MYQYEWIWEGETPKVEWKWITRNGAVSGVPFTADIENDIIKRTQTIKPTLQLKFMEKCLEQGIIANIKSMDLTCQLVKDPLQKTPLLPTPIIGIPFYACNQRFIVKVKASIVFESKQNLAGSPIAPALIIVIAFAIGTLIICSGIAFGFFEAMRNLTLRQTINRVTRRTIDLKTGLVTEEVTENIQQAPTVDISQWIGYITLAIIAVIGVYGVSKVLKTRKKEGEK